MAIVKFVKSHLFTLEDEDDSGEIEEASREEIQLEMISSESRVGIVLTNLVN